GANAMASMKFAVIDRKNFTLIHFEIEKPIKPEILKEIEIPSVDTRKGVVISGRGPIWLHCFLAHKYAHTPFVAVYDPRLGAVVVQSHSELREGDVIDVVVEEILKGGVRHV
uniref:Uncharacterized protein AF_1864 n=1 Tax=Archaeoglobus fulgidus TaxID=2234 RepID=UPI001606F488|nr:Chain A, Uncharacterized protein AF_1864 [Archaeoglobus fulgidus]6YUD_B Chain B, Uncharacterized protein AF_1864 [Archaeoglobus fulgidus]6YUD_C Chain C, Uncharacterized protein AF_1864 [Archaeoglobus fulgidus]6YUD_D Chain D, Uncharacterized protein AF_1864 [Archaeoglobus fulgidus]6YUD_E Chain E, Uncharacterized protein AF_1864 [Archaeoglobus fulgidus]6YUD_F Chain F, Uncharacterized protein AF_1864 [Archaeoglobus fulgidus]6YUD_G Chain G, Uncharacterized protein AF_1864 [Archaeoglobus fulgid